ncbi:hypothetical protein BT93_I0823 [Corymbia citriodora subsp. variegata]|nr:hypothetical protein BT93_I0823 [Corymbia citriodora subsp. variegata]
MIVINHWHVTIANKIHLTSQRLRQHLVTKIKIERLALLSPLIPSSSSPSLSLSVIASLATLKTPTQFIFTLPVSLCRSTGEKNWEMVMMGIERLVGSLKSKLRSLKLKKPLYDKIEKSDSMRVEIRSRKARKLIEETLKVADSPNTKSVAF